MTPATSGLRLRSPADVLAAIPFVVGYHPTDSLVVLGLQGRRIGFSIRGDLPGADAGPEVGPALVDYLLEMALKQQVTEVMLVGYGDAEQVDPMVNGLWEACVRAGLAVRELMRTDGHRYWSYLCQNPRCCPLEGVPYDLVSSPLTTAWTVAGLVARRDREEYEGQLRPVTGPDREAMQLATAHAHDRLVDLIAAAPSEAAAFIAVVQAGDAAVAGALAARRRLTDAEVAWLTVLLVDPAIQDVAWDQTEVKIGLGPGGGWQADCALWMDVMRRAEADLVAGPATLLGLAAWQNGQGGLARLALERAIDQDPQNGLARQLFTLVTNGVPPSALTEAAKRLRRGRVPRPRRRSSSRRAGSRPA